jgi:nitrous oxide reductase accessory protein NosL
MKAVKTLTAALAVAACVAAPVQAQELTPREVFGIAAGAIIGYHIMQERNEPRVIVQQQPQVIVVQPLRQPYCYLRQAYSAPGQGAVYVQECRY